MLIGCFHVALHVMYNCAFLDICYTVFIFLHSLTKEILVIVLS